MRLELIGINLPGLLPLPSDERFNAFGPLFHIGNLRSCLAQSLLKFLHPRLQRLYLRILHLTARCLLRATLSFEFEFTDLHASDLVYPSGAGCPHQCSHGGGNRAGCRLVSGVLLGSPLELNFQGVHGTAVFCQSGFALFLALPHACSCFYLRLQCIDHCMHFIDLRIPSSDAGCRHRVQQL